MSAILNTYNRKKISFKRGKGSFLYVTNGKKYLDFVQGIAVNCLGHSNTYLNNAVQKQLKKVWHVSNVFTILLENSMQVGYRHLSLRISNYHHPSQLNMKFYLLF